MKKCILSLFLCAMLFALLPGTAFAASGTVTLTPRQDSAGVTVTLPQGADSGVTSLRLSFQVDLTGGDAEKTGAQFTFDSALPGSVHEYRYDATTGRLNLYVAGREKLFTDNTVHLGSLVLTTGDAAGATASVTVVENSLELVNAAYGTDKPGVDAQTVELAVGSAQKPSTPEQAPSTPPSSSSSVSSSAPQPSQPAENTTAGGTVTASSSAKPQTAGTKPQSGSVSESEAAESAVSQAPESAASSSSRVPDASASASQSEAPAPSTGKTVMYAVIGVLIAAVLIAAFVVFKRRK